MNVSGPSRKLRLVGLCLVLLCTAGCDQATKHLARAQLGHTGSVMLPGRLIEFTLAENPGAFLSLGASLPQAARGALTFGAGLGLALLLGYLLRAPRLRGLLFLGLALICAGGLSNLIDRFARHGLVTDFMLVSVGPFHTGIFNLADLAVMAGLFMLMLASRKTRRSSAQ
jgi:signal peptidase II